MSFSSSSSTNLALLVAILLGFTALSVVALVEVGLVETFAYQFANWGGIQVLTDLVIMAALASVWMFVDGPKVGLNPWPYIIITMTVASFGPLLYLIARVRKTA